MSDLDEPDLVECKAGMQGGIAFSYLRYFPGDGGVLCHAGS